MTEKKRKKWRFEKRIHDIKRRLLLKELKLLEKELQILEAEAYNRVAESNMLAENLARDHTRLRRSKYVV